jgi:hypothetical protein
MEGQMKAIKLIFVAVMVFVALGLNGWGQESGAGKNDYGIVAGQILDPETGKPVKEKFNVRFYDALYKGEYPSMANGLSPVSAVYPLDDFRSKTTPERPAYGYSVLTDKNGYFKRKFAPGTYGIILDPNDYESSRYCREMNPTDPKMSAEDKKKLTFIIKVTKGKITQFAKKAILGGRIKANIVDKNGNDIDLNTFFNSGTKISIESSKPDLTMPWERYFKNEGNTLSANLFPGIYEVNLTIEWSISGYKNYILKNVLIKNNETTEINFIIDPTDPELKDVINRN